MEVEEAQKAKTELQDYILSGIRRFEKGTDLSVIDIELLTREDFGEFKTEVCSVLIKVQL